VNPLAQLNEGTGIGVKTVPSSQPPPGTKFITNVPLRLNVQTVLLEYTNVNDVPEKARYKYVGNDVLQPRQGTSDELLDGLGKLIEELLNDELLDSPDSDDELLGPPQHARPRKYKGSVP
jgi:hypothetical protein